MEELPTRPEVHTTNMLFTETIKYKHMHKGSEPNIGLTSPCFPEGLKSNSISSNHPFSQINFITRGYNFLCILFLAF